MSIITEVDKVIFNYRTELPTPVLIDLANPPVNKSLLTAFLRNAETLGYTFTPEFLTILIRTDENNFTSWAQEVLQALKETKGAQYNYVPMYPNFPQEVAEATDAELYFNAILHYLTASETNYSTWMPNTVKQITTPLNEKVLLKPISLVQDETAAQVLSNLLSSTISLSANSINSVNILVETQTYNALSKIITSTEISNKENLATLVATVKDMPALKALVFTKLKTATDALRFAAVLSNAHPSLTSPIRFRNFSRPERRLFLTTLNNFSHLSEDFSRYPELWKRLAEKLHPQEKAHQHPEAAAAFRDLQHDNIYTFSARVQNYIINENYKRAAEVLSTRPGEYARRLNELLTLTADNVEDHNYIISLYSDNAHKVSSTVLLQLLSYFRNRVPEPTKENIRVFYPKSLTAHPYLIQDKRAALPEKTIDRITNITLNALIQSYQTKPNLGKVYIAPTAHHHAIPFGYRTASNAYKNLGRGSRIPFNTEKTLRFFLHWENQNNERVDLDLSGIIMDEEFNSIQTLSYYNLQGVGGYHSGDIVDAPSPQGASEFIDITPAALPSNARYIIMTVHSYTGQTFNNLGTALAGFMAREEPNSGETYEPSTVENVFNLTSSSTVSIPVVFDIKTGEAIWLDTPYKNLAKVNNAANMPALPALIKAHTKNNPLSLEELFVIHAQARATEIVTNPDNADIILDYNTIPLDEIISNWL